MMTNGPVEPDDARRGAGDEDSECLEEEAVMNRFRTIVVLAVAAAALVSGMAQAAKPGTPGGPGPR
jgi:hypothetical protein